MAGRVIGSDDDERVRKRKGTRDPPQQNGMGVGYGAGRSNGTSGHKTKKKERVRRKSSPISRWMMALQTSRSPAFVGLAVVASGILLVVTLISATFGGNKCIESHLNGISGNVYTWCYKHNSKGGISSRVKRSLGAQTNDIEVERVVLVDGHAAQNKKEFLKAIGTHEDLSHDIVSEEQSEICYADLGILGDRMDDTRVYHSPAIGPCHHDYGLSFVPLAGSYEEAIEFYFFRDSLRSRYTDRVKCFQQCIKSALTERRDDATEGKHHGHLHVPDQPKKLARDERALFEIEPYERIPVDNVMLIEAAKIGMTLAVEKLFLQYGLDPLYRQVENNPGNSRNFNAIQEAIRGGYAEIVAILTRGDNSIVIDEYGRTVEDYVRMSGSPVRPIDAKNVLGIEVEEGTEKRPVQKAKAPRKESGWDETAADPYNEERCDFDIVDGDLDPMVFYKEYFMTGRPVVLRGQAPQMELDMFSKERWYKSKRFNPDKAFQVGPTAYPSLTLQEHCQKKMSINDIEQGKVCEEMPEKPMVHAFHPDEEDLMYLYPVFEGDVLDERGGFRSIKHFFPLVEHWEDANWQVFFGGDGSGATFHWHEAAFNILYVGVKEWKIAPPLYRGLTGMPAQRVAETLDPKISLTCVQHAGDMFYIPNFWGHSTYNHGFTIGAAAIVQDWYQNGGASYRGDAWENYEQAQEVEEVEEEEEEEEEEEKEEEEDEEDEGSPPFLFVHINKTGGTSLIHMFGDRCEEEYWGEYWYDSDGEFHRSFHATAHAYIERYGREAWDNAYSFTVVRHPLARQVSNFFFLASMGCDKPNNKCAERLIPTLDLDAMSDEEKIEAFHIWLAKIYEAFPPGSPDHYRFGAAGHGNEVYDTFGASQTSWNVDSEGKYVTKDFYKLEELSKDITKLAENIPCLKNGPLEMDKKNKTSKYPNYMLFAKDEKTKQIINEVFAEDFKNFGYDPL